MRVFTRCCLLLLILFCLPVAHGARIYGAIYDRDLNPISKTVVSINSSPPQRHISKYGGYSFSVNEGHYLIVANLTINNVTREIASEDVAIDDDGEYRMDLFVYDNINMSSDFTPVDGQGSVYWIMILSGLVLLGALFLAIVWYHKKIARLVRAAEPSRDDGGSLERRIMRLIKKNKGELEQRLIRKELPYSESKISMVLSDMEQKGLCHKVKQGRKNLIRIDTER